MLCRELGIDGNDRDSIPIRHFREHLDHDPEDVGRNCNRFGGFFLVFALSGLDFETDGLALMQLGKLTHCDAVSVDVFDAGPLNVVRVYSQCVHGPAPCGSSSITAFTRNKRDIRNKRK